MIVSEILKASNGNFVDFHNFMKSLGFVIYSYNQEIPESLSIFCYLREIKINSYDDLIEKLKFYSNSNSLRKIEILKNHQKIIKNSFYNPSALILRTLSRYLLYEKNEISFDTLSLKEEREILIENIDILHKKITKFCSIYLIRKEKHISTQISDINNKRESIIKENYEIDDDNKVGFVKFGNSRANFDIIYYKSNQLEKIKGSIENIQLLIELENNLKELNEQLKEVQKEIKEFNNDLNELKSFKNKIEGFEQNCPTNIKLAICKLSENQRLAYNNNKSVYLSIDYETFKNYLTEVDIEHNESLICNYYELHNKDSNTITHCSIAVYICTLENNNPKKSVIFRTIYFKNNNLIDNNCQLINFCDSHIKFINSIRIGFKFIKNNPFERKINKFNSILLDKLLKIEDKIAHDDHDDYKAIYIRLVYDLKNGYSFNLPNTVHRIGRRRNNNDWVDDESLIMNSFYKGTNENFGL